MGVLYFHELPVYRLTYEAYYASRDAYVAKHLRAVGAVAGRRALMPEPEILAAWKGSLQRSFGGCWEFNEIIGYIRLHFLGTQVRGEYFATATKKKVRTRTKTFEYKTWKLAPEAFIERPYGKTQIVAAIYEYIDGCRRELPRRFIDTSIFDVVCPHMDWPALLNKGNA